MPFYSIIIPTYNSDKTIVSCIDSVLSQTFKDFEILIMDGISMDRTLDLVKEFNDTRIKVNVQKDRGVYDAMNLGIDKASGEWLYFLGSDDYLLEPSVLENVHKKIQEGQPDFIYGNVNSPDLGEEYDGEFDLLKLTKQNICHQAVFCKAKVFEKVGRFDIRYTIHADYDFALRCFLNKDVRVQFIPLKIAFYAPGGLSMKKPHDVFTKNFRKILIYYGWYTMPEKILKRFYPSRFKYLVSLIKRKLFFPPPPLDF
jgi:glycosyltransferase involved in cell wall biosynthesis